MEVWKSNALDLLHPKLSDTNKNKIASIKCWNFNSLHHLLIQSLFGQSLFLGTRQCPLFSSQPLQRRGRNFHAGGHEGPDGVSTLGLFVGSRTVPSYMTLFLMPSWIILCCTRSLALFILQYNLERRRHGRVSITNRHS